MLLTKSPFGFFHWNQAVENETKIASKTASNSTRFTRIAKASNRHVSTTDPQNLDRHN